MQMINLLATVWPYINHGLKAGVSPRISAPQLLRERRSEDHHFTKQRRVLGLTIGQSFDVSLWNDQRVNRRSRMDVMKRQEILILVDFLTWNLASDDFAENTIVRAHVLALSDINSLINQIVLTYYQETGWCILVRSTRRDTAPSALRHYRCNSMARYIGLRSNKLIQPRITRYKVHTQMTNRKK